VRSTRTSRSMPYKNKAHQRQFQRERNVRLRREWLEAHGPCKCGSWIDLQVDHIDPAKKVSHRIWSWSKERREAELAKCQPLCLECHKAKTRSQYRQRGGVRRTCERCHAEFLIRPSDVARGRGRFCSSPCHGRGRRVTTGRGVYRRPIAPEVAA